MIPQSYIIIQQSNPTIQIEDRDVVVVNYSTVKGDQGDPGETFIPSQHAADIVAALAGQIRETELDGALQNKITLIETKANAAETAVALLEQADQILQASVEDHALRIVGAENSLVVVENTVSQLGVDLSTLDGTLTGQASLIEGLTTRITVAEGDIDSQASSISGLAARVDNQDQTIAGQVISLNSVIADVSVIDGIVTAQGTDISTLQATVGDHTSYIEVEQQVRAATIAPDWNSLVTYGIGQTVQYLGAVYTSKQANNLNHSPSDIAWWGVSGNLYAQYTVKVGAGGKIAGFGLAASDTGPSVFEVLADKFAIANNSGGQTTYPFVVGQVGGVSTVGINGNLVIDGTLVVGDNVEMGPDATITWQKVTSIPTSISRDVIYWEHIDGATVVDLVGPEGSKVLRMTNAGYPNDGRYIPVSIDRKYKVKFWAKANSADGYLYFSLQQFKNASGTTCDINTGRSPYKPANISAHAGWRLYEYIWGGADWQAGVTHVRPEFLGNYAGTNGSWDIQGFSMEDVTILEKSLGFSLIGRSGVVPIGNCIRKLTGVDWWAGDAYSIEGYTGGAYCSFSPDQANADLMVGLDQNPTEDAGYSTLDYAVFCTGAGVLYSYESNVPTNIGTYVAGDVLSIIYDGVSVKYLKNGTVLREVTASVPANAKFYLDSCIYNIGASVSNVKFGPMSNNQWSSIGGIPNLVLGDGSTIIGPNFMYSGTISANQIDAGTLNVDRINSGDISHSVVASVTDVEATAGTYYTQIVATGSLSNPGGRPVLVMLSFTGLRSSGTTAGDLDIKVERVVNSVVANVGATVYQEYVDVGYLNTRKTISLNLVDLAPTAGDAVYRFRLGCPTGLGFSVAAANLCATVLKK